MLDNELLTTEEAATYLGVSRATFYNHIREAGVSGYKRMGDRRVYYRMDELQDLAGLRPVNRSRRRKARYNA